MHATTLPRYLVGSRSAILGLASSKSSFWIGLILVVSAGLAREYDGEDLVHEPWHALRPLAASLASGTALFLLVHLVALLKSSKSEARPPGFFNTWRCFLGLFWLTAPMAWLYAVPYERFLPPVQAIELNLWTLGLVALWRVVLISRVIQVVYRINYAQAFFLVMLFADAVVFIVVLTVPTPVIDVMGGIRHSERDALIAGVTSSVMILSVITAPLWAIGALVAVATLRPAWPGPPKKPAGSGSHGLLVLAVVSVAAFVPLLIVSQPEQINKREAERLLTTGRVPEALALMSQNGVDAYPPHWNPPPRIGYREKAPSLIEVRDAMTRDWPACWVAERYLGKIDRDLRNALMPFHGSANWAQIAKFVQERPEAYPAGDQHRVTALFLYEHLGSLSEEDRQGLKAIAEGGSNTTSED